MFWKINIFFALCISLMLAELTLDIFIINIKTTSKQLIVTN